MHRREYLFQIKNGFVSIAPPFRWFDSPDTRGCKSHSIACAMLSTAGLLTYLSCHTFPTLWLCQSCGQWFLWYKPLSANILQTIQGENYSSEYCFGFGVFRCPFFVALLLPMSCPTFLRPCPSFSGSPFVGLSVLPTEFPFAPPSVETVYGAKIVKKEEKNKPKLDKCERNCDFLPVITIKIITLQVTMRVVRA